MKAPCLLRLLSAALCAFAFASCGAGRPRNPVTLSVWHTYVEQMSFAFSELVDEFNRTQGQKSGVSVKVTSIANAGVLNEKLLMAANEEPGAPELPDMAVVYPAVAVSLAEKGLLAEIGASFSEAELAAFIPGFLDEGRLLGPEGERRLYLLPVAKSTEVLYVNKTAFGRFADDGGASLADLATVEGIAAAAERYFAWSGGKAFFYPESPFNWTMSGYEQISGGKSHFVQNGMLDLYSEAFEKIWNAYAPPAHRGRFKIFNDYANYLMKTGEVVCATGSSAGAIFYPETVTYADNRKEAAEIVALPYPVFSGGEKVAAQRGGGMAVFRTRRTAAEQKAAEAGAAVFLKWFTAPEHNARFAMSTGYLPVTAEAFGRAMEGEIPAVENPAVRSMFECARAMQKEYRFYAQPAFSGLEELQRRYKNALLEAAREGASLDEFRRAADK